MALNNHRMVHLSPDGRFFRAAFGKLGTEPADIYEGWGTAFDQAGNIMYCHRLPADEAAGIDRESVKVFTPQGGLVREIIAPDNGNPESCLSVHVNSRAASSWSIILPTACASLTRKVICCPRSGAQRGFRTR